MLYRWAVLNVVFVESGVYIAEGVCSFSFAFIGLKVLLLLL